MILRFPKCLWIDGCSKPRIKNYQIDIELKPDARPKAMQPFHLSEFDQLRVDWMVEEECLLGKRVMYDPKRHELPEHLSAMFCVDQKGKGLLGRVVTAYGVVNDATVPTSAAAPDVERAFRSSVGHRLHTTCDLVWGYTQCDLTERASRALACVTRTGINFPLCAPFGPSNFPSIFHSKMDSEFGGLRDAESDDPNRTFVVVAIDDFKISSKTYPDHLRQVLLFFSKAESIGAEFKLAKCVFGAENVEFWGFILDQFGRKPSPSKIQQLREWPDYEGIEDLRSHVHFAEYLNEFMPELPEVIYPLRKYLKKGALFSEYLNDPEAMAAKRRLTELVVDKCVIVNPDFTAAADPFGSGRPFELFSDASEYGWCVVLTQRPQKNGTPGIIGLAVRSFTATQMKWTPFEMEFFGFTKGMLKMEPYVKGFFCIAWTDHKNSTFVDVLRSNKRINKKITNLALEIQDLPHQKVWRRGVDMVIADSPSRWATHQGRVKELVYDLPLPSLSVHEVISRLFKAPEEFEQLAQRYEVHRRAQTCLGIPEPPEQGLLLEMSPTAGVVSAVVKLNSCETSDPILGDRFWLRESGVAQDKFKTDRRQSNETVQIWGFSEIELPLSKGAQSKELSFKRNEVERLARFASQCCEEWQEHGKGFVVFNVFLGCDALLEFECMKKLRSLPGVFDVRFDSCAYGQQLPSEEASDVFVPTPRWFCTNLLPLAPLGRHCPGTNKKHAHVSEVKSRKEILPLPLNFVQSLVERIKETGLLRGSKRLHRGKPEVCVDSHGRKITFVDSVWHPTRVPGSDGNDSITDPSGFSTNLELSDSEEENETELRPVRPVEKPVTEETLFCKEFFGRTDYFEPEAVPRTWPRFPRFRFAETDTEKLLNMTSLAATPMPKSGSGVPKCLRKLLTNKGLAYSVEFEKEVEFADGTTKDRHTFLPRDFGEGTRSAAWDYFKDCLAETYCPEGTPDGRGPKAGNYHGDEEHEFKYYKFPKDSAQLDVVDWDPKTDCVINPRVYCTNARKKGPSFLDAETYICMGHFVGGMPTPKAKAKAGAPVAVAPVAESSSSAAVYIPTLKEILWDVRTRVSMGIAPTWQYRFGLQTVPTGGFKLSTLDENHASLLRAVHSGIKQSLNSWIYNAVAVFRNVSKIELPAESYGVKCVLYCKGVDEPLQMSVNSPASGRLKLVNGVPFEVPGGAALDLSCSEENVGLVAWSVKDPANSPALRDNGYPIRDDSHKPLPKQTEVKGRLSDSELSSYGYERRALSALTESCPDFGPIYRFKVLEEQGASVAEVRRKMHAFGWTTAQINQAINTGDRYELNEGLLYRFEFDVRHNALSYSWCVPKGSTRATRVLGGAHKVDVRTELILWYHSAHSFGNHSAYDATLSKLVIRYHWPKMADDVDEFIRKCLECKQLRARPFVSAAMRADIYDGPFVAVFFDHVGPLRPQSTQGSRYILTCVCAFSGWGWAIPVPNDTAEETAKGLFNRVYCDIAGFPIFIRHDRSQSFLANVIKEINRLFGITALVGTSWRPQCQGVIETTHRKLGLMLRTLCEQFPETWEERLPMAVWAWRVTPQPSLGGLSPYRIATGLEPRTPFSIATNPSVRLPRDVGDYVKELAEVYESTLEFVRKFRRDQLDVKENVQSRKLKTGTFEVGDFVLVLKAEFIASNHRPGPVSKKLMHRVHDGLYQVHNKPSANSFVVKLATTGEEPVGFSNPINLHRLIPAVAWQIGEPLGTTPKRIEVKNEDEETTRTGTVVGYGYGGVVRIRFDGVTDEEWVDLAAEEYSWVV